MKKIISFSLWGNDPKYCIGAAKNAVLAKKIYPDWKCRYYICNSVTDEVINQLESFENSEIVLMDEVGNWKGMFWRFLPAFEDQDNIVICRDVDSRLNFREKAAVDQWLSSSKDFHIMRDHPIHNRSILGGLWGVRNRLLVPFFNEFQNFKKGDYYQVDQDFLETKVYPIVNSKTLVHDEYFERKAFPIQRKGDEFVGEVFDEFDKRDKFGQTVLKDYYKKNYFGKLLHRNRFILKNSLRRYINFLR